MADEHTREFLAAISVCAVGASAVYMYKKRRAKARRRQHRYWVKPWIQRSSHGGPIFQLYQSILQADDTEEFRMTLRMPKPVYDELLELVRPLITKRTTNFRAPIPADQRLALTLRFLAFGDSYLDLHQQFLVGKSTAGAIVRETCAALFYALKDTYLVTPSTSDEWKNIAHGFASRWNLPNCLGAIDGKHIRIKAPAKSGSLYYNYKEYFSIVLMAIVDHNYEFIYVDVGAEGRASDGGIWRQSSFHQHMEDPANPLNIPSSSHVEGYSGNLPYFFVGDDAFQMSPYLLKPYPMSSLSKKARIYNYQISRARRIVENAFGIMASKFRIFRKEIELSPAYVDNVVLAGVVLHNFCRRKCGKNYLPPQAVDHEDAEHELVAGLWRQEREVDHLQGSQNRNPNVTAKRIRDNLANYFVTKAGEVPWQYKAALVED